MSLIGNITTSIIGHLNIENEVEKLAAPAAAKLVVPHVNMTEEELATAARRARDMAACFEHRPPKLQEAFTEYFQIAEDALD